ncbi:hypothetical protein H5410_036709 [Solanum commersonii]|uniref:Uncharacterized protein n=1 Tax=Solanum commersonii TaxID=4109 RepID=A0A9J5Y5M3_SOLCO|nr:hypothetical protein H5410_036709 [Solanum commersonii]
MDIVNEATGKMRTEVIQITYDYVPKYGEECIMQGHNKKECRISNNHKGRVLAILPPQQQIEIAKIKNEEERKSSERIGNNSDAEVRAKQDALAVAPILTTIPTPQQNAIIDQWLNMNENEGKIVHMLMRPSQKIRRPNKF